MMSKRTIAEVIGAITLMVLSISNAAFADRVATTIITNISAAVTPVLSQNLAVPVGTFPVASSSGAVTQGLLYFEVTARDGTGGETVGSNLMATTSLGGQAYNITWPAVQGATGYRVYFSTSTPVALTQFFNASTTNGTTIAFNFTSTSSPLYIATGVPVTNSAYVIKVLPNGNTFLNGGNVAIGTSTPVANFQVAATATTSSSTVELGAANRSVGTCVKLYRGDGSAIYAWVNTGATAFTLATTPCATVTGF